MMSCTEEIEPLGDEELERKQAKAEEYASYPFEHTDLANLAEVNPIVVDRMLTDQPVARWQAIEVLRVLTMITKNDYSLDTVDVVLYPET